jgi:hypothetical protein
MAPIASPGADSERAFTPFAPIRHQVEERLRRSQDLALREVPYLAGDDAVSLHGWLASSYLNQVAWELASDVAGVPRVIIGSGASDPRRGRSRAASSSSTERPQSITAPSRLGRESSPNAPQTKGIRNDVGPEPKAE